MEHAVDCPALRGEFGDGQPHLAVPCPQALPQRDLQVVSEPLFIEKVRDIVGLYLHPPERAVVLCVDEESQIEALDRTQPLLPVGPGSAQK